MRRFGMLALAVLLVVTLLAGCGSKSGEAGEEHVLSGTVEEKKDFMLVVADDNGDEYALTIDGDNKPEGWDNAAAGDRVNVTYTGELSVVDSFTGEVLSVEKID